MKTLIQILALSLILPNTSFAASTVAYYKCTSREGGEWNFGRAPDVCDASAFGKDSVAYGDYPGQIFMDTASRTPERTRYMTSVFAVVRDAAKYYLLKHNPTASADEIKYWEQLVETTSAHESYMSHYRKTTDTHLKMMRGDSGHGHGLMQIDDRWHLDAINQGQAWALIANLSLGMDILYPEWVRAPSQSCVGSSTNWMARMRSAWAAFNGGSSSICRWTNTNSSWAANDKNFYNMLSQATWKTYVTDQNAPASINVQCLTENGSNCPAPGTTPTVVKPVTGILYQVSSTQYCVLAGGSLHCVTTAGDALCLAYYGSSIDTSTSTPLASISGYAVVKEDRHALCEEYDKTLIPVGTSLVTKVGINLRSTAGGTSLSQIPAGTTLSVIDFVIRNQGANDRYYYVQYNNQKGYLYAGNVTTYSAWATAAPAVHAVATNVAVSGQSVTVVAPNGINLRSTAGGALIMLVPKGSVLKVSSILTQGSTNEVYYQVSYGGHTGYVYTGSLKPADTTLSWTKLNQ